mmetsp:Transcript_34945/g.96527  ORF Transcript_34945/g.96527 Transcript_34945/m.96527 type:complete len:239 (-) Transcript_34945:411-1127(-)
MKRRRKTMMTATMAVTTLRWSRSSRLSCRRACSKRRLRTTPRLRRPSASSSSWKIACSSCSRSMATRVTRWPSTQPFAVCAAQCSRSCRRSTPRCRTLSTCMSVSPPRRVITIRPLFRCAYASIRVLPLVLRRCARRSQGGADGAASTRGAGPSAGDGLDTAPQGRTRQPLEPSVRLSRFHAAAAAGPRRARRPFGMHDELLFCALHRDALGARAGAVNGIEAPARISVAPHPRALIK